jgi:hypothetical protein
MFVVLRVVWFLMLDYDPTRKGHHAAADCPLAVCREPGDPLGCAVQRQSFKPDGGDHGERRVHAFQTKVPLYACLRQAKLEGLWKYFWLLKISARWSDLQRPEILAQSLQLIPSHIHIREHLGLEQIEPVVNHDLHHSVLKIFSALHIPVGLCATKCRWAVRCCMMSSFLYFAPVFGWYASKYCSSYNLSLLYLCDLTHWGHAGLLLAGTHPSVVHGTIIIIITIVVIGWYASECCSWYYYYCYKENVPLGQRSW